ncbi:fimbrillin family protein [Alistipes senegalensis]|uniref:Fimbrillin family protein n=1 Tax=Alistipes senegalensis JC50 TaxID=1033732 RepID=A0ABY5V5V3_9BACT|nr:fimbrillin family protein [Alistipes senegalensis]UEA88219.1 fimbrillin family protein [Alistipes senegalensis]UWN64191.1 fimbrillin family protein [Alistipes senegalensis JC50]
MKIQNIYHLLQAALLLLLVSCTQEEFPAVQDKAQQLTISVTDGGYTSAVENMKTRVETRAVENGYTTEFTEGDACGFYMVRGGKPVYSNVKLTAEKDAATGGIMWKTDGTTLAAGMDGESYYLYYPYQADMAGKTATPAEGAVMTDAEFFKPLIDGWQPGDDQSTHAAYTASDLMTAGGSTTGTGNTIHLSFAMKHRMALAVIEMPKTVYKFIDANVPDYTVGAEATFTGTAKPLRMADGTYRYLVHSSMPTIEGCYDGGNREFTITTSASHPVVGEYKRYKVDGAAETIKNVTYAESGIARIGDFYCTKNNGTTGYLIPKEADETTVQAAKVVGIVFQTDKSRIGAKEKEKLGGEGNVHGLVMAVKNIATRQAWGLFGMDEGLTTCRTKADNYNDISGYGNCEHIRTNRGNFDSYPAFKAAYDYNTTCPVPATTTGWYLLASGQWWDILQNLGGCPALADVTQQTSPDTGEFLWKSQGDVPAALNKWMENIAVGDKDTFNNLVSFCSSSEHSKYHTWYWILNNFQGMVRCIWASKFDGSDNVRPVLAF